MKRSNVGTAMSSWTQNLSRRRPRSLKRPFRTKKGRVPALRATRLTGTPLPPVSTVVFTLPNTKTLNRTRSRKTSEEEDDEAHKKSAESGGFSWGAFFLGPLWFLMHGLLTEALIIFLVVFILTLASGGFLAIPAGIISCFYCAATFNDALLKHRIKDGELIGGVTRQCPFCAETIRAKAKTCRYCSRALPPETPEVNAHQRG